MHYASTMKWCFILVSRLSTRTTSSLESVLYEYAVLRDNSFTAFSAQHDINMDSPPVGLGE